MRRWLLIAVLLALAGLLVLALRRNSTRPEQVGTEQAPASATPADAEHAVQSESGAQRAPLSAPVETPAAAQPAPSAPELAQKLDGRVVGKVLCAETREPVAGARVRVLTGGRPRTEWHTPGPDERTTGNDGVFELAFESQSDPLLCVEAAGYGLRYANLDNVHTDLAHALVVWVSRCATLDVRVLDASGKPVEKATVELSTPGWQMATHEADDAGFFSCGLSFSFPPDERWRGETGADGRARIEGLPARVELVAQVATPWQGLRRVPGGLKFLPGEVRQVDWRVGSGTSVRGLALDQDGKPVAGLDLWLTKSGTAANHYFLGYEHPRVDLAARTDGEGRFALEDLAPGRWAIGPSPENECLVAPLADAFEVSGESSFQLTLHVFRGLFIRGRVLAPSGEGAPNCWVNGFPTADERLEGARSESDGSFALGPLGPGTLTLMADAISRYASSDPVQASAGDRGVVLQLKQGGMIRGRVVDGETGAACVAQLVLAPEQALTGILASGLQTSTNPDGTFGAAGLAAGRWSVTAATADGRFAQHAHVEVGAGSDSGELVFPLSPGGRLRLSYKGAQPGLFVTVTRDGAAVLMQQRVEPGKNLECMAPAGALVLELRKGFMGPARTRSVELKPGETKEITLTDED